MIKSSLLGVAALLAIAGSSDAWANGEQFIPILSYRTGPYAPNGIPYANGFVDYLELVNRRDGGVNGVKLAHEECETAYATDRGVECYERLKGKGPTGAAFVNPVSTGITFALTEKAPTDKIPVITFGYGRSESKDGSVFQWNFPLLGTYWTAADIIVQYLAKEVGGTAALRGKKIVHLYLDSPYGKEPLPVLEANAQKYGFSLTPMPVTAPGLEQKSQWLQIRQLRPDYVILWGYGVMDPTAMQEAASVNFPRDRIVGGWWAGAEPDVAPAGQQGVGYKAVMLQHGASRGKVHAEIEKHVVAAGASRSKSEEVGQVLYNRGLLNALLGVEALRTAQAKFGNRPLTGEEVRWGLENLKIDAGQIEALGIEEMVRPFQVSCANHQGPSVGRIHQWDGKNWKIVSDWIQADDTLLDPMVKAAAAKYRAEKNLPEFNCAQAQ
jgi:branched-chain amino acid transport system substrate-binding protein